MKPILCVIACCAALLCSPASPQTAPRSATALVRDGSHDLDSLIAIGRRTFAVFPRRWPDRTTQSNMTASPTIMILDHNAFSSSSTSFRPTENST